MTDSSGKKGAATLSRLIQWGKNAESFDHADVAAQNGQVGLWTWSRTTRKLYLNCIAAEMLGFRKQARKISPRKISSRIHPDDLIHWNTIFHVGKSLDEQDFPSFRIRLEGDWPGWRYLEVHGGTCTLDEESAFAGSLHDVSDEVKIKRRLKHHHNHDKLTGLLSRESFMEGLEQKLALPDRRNVALIFLNIDHFKRIIENLGNRASNDILREVALRLAGVVGSHYLLSRIVGDEFALAVDDAIGATTLENLAYRLVRILEEPIVFGGNEVFLTASAGIAIAEPKREISGEDLLAEAHSARLAARQAGTGRVVRHSFNLRAREKASYELANQLHRAIDNDELFVQYQPIVNLEKACVDSFEALIRWNHPERGIVSPVEFVPVAEESGLILQLGEWLMKAACSQMKTWIDAGYSDLSVAINLSPPQFILQDVSKLVAGALKSTRLPGKNLKVEVTESLILHEDVLKKAPFEKLAKENVRICIDDFGTGFSALSYLKRFPFDVLKIDREFIRDLPQDKASEAIVRAVIRMAQDLGISVICEGVESQEQVDFLFESGCHLIQGYFFSPPLNSDEAGQYLQQMDGV